MIFAESKKYFFKAFAKLNFSFKFEENNRFYNLKNIIFDFPSFNLNQIQTSENNEFSKTKEINEKLSNVDESKNTKSKLCEKYFETNEKIVEKSLFDYFNKNDYFEDEAVGEERIFSDPNELFDMIIDDYNFKKAFIEDVKNIIELMEKQIYTPPYKILFGRIDTKRTRLASNNQNEVLSKDINKLFFEGFGL